MPCRKLIPLVQLIDSQRDGKQDNANHVDDVVTLAKSMQVLPGWMSGKICVAKDHLGQACAYPRPSS